jgi:hypothetical protein
MPKQWDHQRRVPLSYCPYRRVAYMWALPMGGPHVTHSMAGGSMAGDLNSLSDGPMKRGNLSSDALPSDVGSLTYGPMAHMSVVVQCVRGHPIHQMVRFFSHSHTYWYIVPVDI